MVNPLNWVVVRDTKSKQKVSSCKLGWERLICLIKGKKGVRDSEDEFPDQEQSQNNNDEDNDNSTGQEYERGSEGASLLGSPRSVVIAPVLKQDIERQQQEELKLLSQNPGMKMLKWGNHAEGNANFTKRVERNVKLPSETMIYAPELKLTPNNATTKVQPERVQPT